MRQGSLWKELFDEKYLELPIAQEILKLGAEEVPVVCNCFFIKNSELWYLIGTNKGRLLAFPAILSPNRPVLI